MRTWLAATSFALLIAGPAGPESSAADAPTRSGVDRAFVSPDVRPQDDLFRHVNGEWLDHSPIPADRPLDGAFYKLRDQSEADLRAIIEETAAKPDSAGEGSKKVGDLFASFMDEARIDEARPRTAPGRIDLIRAIADKADLVEMMAA